MTNRYVLLLLLLFSVLISVQAEDTYTLTVDQAVESALENNSTLLTAGIDRNIALDSVEHTWNTFLPTIKGTMNLSDSGRVFIRPDDLYSGSSGLSASLSVALPLSLSLPEQMKARKLSYAAALLDYEQSSEALIMDVKLQFYYLLAAREDLRLKQKNIDLAEKRYDQGVINFRNGLTSELQMLTTQLSYESLKPVYSQAKADYESQMLLFKHSLGLDLDRNIELTGSIDVVPVHLDTDKLIKLCMEENFDLRSLAQNLAILENSSELLRKSSLYPSAQVGGSYTVSNPDWGDLFSGSSWNDYFALTCAFSIPVDVFISGSETNLSLKENREAINKLNISIQEAKTTLILDLTNRVNQLAATEEQINISNLNLSLAERAYEMAEQAYALGTYELLEVEAAQADLFEAQQTLLLNKYEYLSGLIELEYLLNTSFENFSREN